MLAGVAVVGIGAVVLTKGGDDEDLSGGSEAVQAVLDYIDAAKDSDCEALIDMVTEESVEAISFRGRSDAVAECEDAVSDGDGLPAANIGDIQSTEELNEGSEATVVLVSRVDGATEDTQSFFSLVREDGAWKLDVVESDWAPAPSELPTRVEP